jgi:hypothetical protein
MKLPVGESALLLARINHVMERARKATYLEIEAQTNQLKVRLARFILPSNS